MNFVRMKAKIVFLILLVLIVVSATGCETAGTGKDEKAVAKVNSKVISYDLYNKHLILFKKNYEDMYGDKVWSLDVGGKTFLQAVQENVLEKLINDEVTIQYLQDKKIEIDQQEVDSQYEEYSKRMKDQEEAQKFLDENGIDENFIKDQIKTDLYMKKFQDDIIGGMDLNDEKLKTYYDEHVEDYRNVQVKASHILVETEQEANDILEKIKAGEDFGELAIKYSKDPSASQGGGDLGYFSKGTMVKEFEEASFSMEIGQISQPVKTTFGYHIIKVTDKKDELIPFENVKEEIKGNLIEREMIDKYNEIKKDYKIEKFEENIK